jgi:monofunctional biosynthetic peptidoglycan transglycosylase
MIFELQRYIYSVFNKVSQKLKNEEICAHNQKMAKKRKTKNFLFRWVKRILIFFFASTILLTVLYKWINPPITPLMLIRLLEQKKADKDLVLAKKWVDLEKISKNLPLAVMVCEDQHFMTHRGFDIESIKKARAENKEGKARRGASTISQQTAKNVFLWPESSWLRKGLEVYFTALIELIWGKERIMEIYLNVIEMGEGVYGAEKASHYYFRKSAEDLSRNQAALLAVCLPNPRKMTPAKMTPYRVKRQLWALQQMSYFPYLDFSKKKKSAE